MAGDEGNGIGVAIGGGEGFGAGGEVRVGAEAVTGFVWVDGAGGGFGGEVGLGVGLEVGLVDVVGLVVDVGVAFDEDEEAGVLWPLLLAIFIFNSFLFLFY